MLKPNEAEESDESREAETDDITAPVGIPITDDNDYIFDTQHESDKKDEEEKKGDTLIMAGFEYPPNSSLNKKGKGCHSPSSFRKKLESVSADGVGIVVPRDVVGRDVVGNGNPNAENTKIPAIGVPTDDGMRFDNSENSSNSCSYEGSDDNDSEIFQTHGAFAIEGLCGGSSTSSPESVMVDDEVESFVDEDMEPISAFIVSSATSRPSPEEGRQMSENPGSIEATVIQDMPSSSTKTKKNLIFFFNRYPLVVVPLVITFSFVLVFALSMCDFDKDVIPQSPVVSSAPSTTPTIAPTSERFKILSSIVLSAMESISTSSSSLTVSNMSDTSSPQGKALQWLANVDVNTTTHAEMRNKVLQRYSLATLFFATGGKGEDGKNVSWFNVDGYLTSNDECTWFGVTCAGMDDSGTFLVGIDLPLTGLEGSLPNEIGLLTNLRFLNIFKNLLQGTVPETLGNLHQLEYFDASFNRLTGTLPQSMSQLTALRQMDLGFNGLSGTLVPSILRPMSNLTSILLSYNQFHGAVSDSIQPLYQTLEVLGLAGNNFYDSIHFTSNFNQLKYLSLHANHFTGTIPSAIGHNMNSVEHLEIDDNSFSGSIPTSLGMMTNLTFLALSRNKFTGSIPSSVGSLTNLNILALQENQFNGTIPSSITHLGSLVSFFVDSNHITGVMPSEMGKMENLRMLGLRENQISGQIPSSIADISNLAILDLASNRLTGPLPATFMKLSRLWFISVMANNLGGDISFMCNSSHHGPNFIYSDCLRDNMEHSQITCQCCSEESCCGDGYVHGGENYVSRSSGPGSCGVDFSAYTIFLHPDLVASLWSCYFYGENYYCDWASALDNFFTKMRDG